MRGKWGTAKGNRKKAQEGCCVENNNLNSMHAYPVAEISI